MFFFPSPRAPHATRGNESGPSLFTQNKRTCARALPMEAPTAATAIVRVDGPAAALVQPGDRDALLDSRSARVTGIAGRGSDGTTVTITLGLDASREGWRYRGRLIRPGGTLTIETDRYEAVARVLSLTPVSGVAK